MFGSTYLPLVYLGFNLLLFLITLKLAIALHEIGHLLFAKCVGGRPRRILLGRGHKVIEQKFKGIKIILNSEFNGGFAYASFKDLNFIRGKLFVYISGGFLVNFMIAGLCMLLFDISTHFSSGIQFASIGFFVNLLAGIAALLPYHFNYNGLRFYTDGLAILQIPFFKKSRLTELASTNELLDAYDFFEAKKYDEAIAIYEKLKSQNENLGIININLSIAYLKKGDYKRSAELMEEYLPFIDDKEFKPYKNTIDNGLAWSYLLLNRLDEADMYSERAYKNDWNSLSIKGTRGSVLIEIGRFEEGKNLLLDCVDFAFPNNQTLGAAIYLTLAFQELGENLKVEKHRQFVQENIKMLDLDEKTLFDKIMQKVG